MVADQGNVVDNPSIDIKTGQSNRGVSTGGGIRLGEMEKDNANSNGTSHYVQYKMIDTCDKKDVCVCTKCGHIAVSNPKIGLYVCKTCKFTTFVTVKMTTSTLTYFNYLEALGISIKINLENSKFLSE
jgi:DNA-directed RNA polymerase beta subunit